MDNYTGDLLKAWDCDHLIDSFRDARIDAVALGLLKENDIISLIPIIGDRLKFEANLSMWKADNNSVVEGSESANISLSNIINDLEGPEELVNREVDQERNQADREKIQTILQKSLRGRALLTAGSGSLLDSSQRKELGNLILDHELEQNPNVQLKWAQFQSWSRGICELFTKESPVLYYTSYVAAGAFQAKRNASGILYNTYLRKRKNLTKKKVTAVDCIGRTICKSLSANDMLSRRGIMYSSIRTTFTLGSILK